MNWSVKTVNQTELKWFPYWFLSWWIVALGILTSPRIFCFYSRNCPTWSAEQTDINQAGKGVYCILQDSRSFPWGKYSKPFWVFSFLFQQKIRPHGRLYGRLCRTRAFCVQCLSGPQCYLSSYQLFQQKRWSTGSF